MTRFVFICHGESHMNRDALLCTAKPGLRLSSEGQNQALDLGNQLETRFDAVYSSPATGALQTAKPLAEQLSVPLLIDNELVEINVGSIQGTAIHEGRNSLEIGWDRSLADGTLDELVALDVESGSSATLRFSAVIERICSERPLGTVAVVCHVGLIQLALPALCKNLPANYGRKHWLRNAQTVEAHTRENDLICDIWAATSIHQGVVESPSLSSAPSPALNKSVLDNKQTSDQSAGACGIEEVLAGGGVNALTRIGNTVRRPKHPWTTTVHALLGFLNAQGFDGVPAVHGFDDQGREILEFVAGSVGNYPLTGEVRSESALLSSAQLLRRFHDASRCALGHLPDGWQLPPLEPVEVVCHSDFAPYNCVYREGIAVSIIDFDMARPGPRIWDLAYALYRFAPLTHANNSDGFGDISVQSIRARQFLDSYGATREQRAQALEMVPLRLQALVEFMRDAAEQGNSSFAHHIDDGHLDLYLRDISYVEAHYRMLMHVVVDG